MSAAPAHPHRNEVRYDARSRAAEPAAADPISPATRTGAALSAAAPVAAPVLAVLAPAVPVRPAAVALVPGPPPRLEIPGHQTPHPARVRRSSLPLQTSECGISPWVGESR